jgi:hypothetical protein
LARGATFDAANARTLEFGPAEAQNGGPCGDQSEFAVINIRDATTTLPN